VNDDVSFDQPIVELLIKASPLPVETAIWMFWGGVPIVQLNI